MVLVILSCSPLNAPTNSPVTPSVDTRFDQTIGIIVNKNLYPSIKPSIDRYAQDLSTIEGKKVWINGTTFNKYSSVFELHDSLVTRYESGDLEGTVLIGDLPAAQYEIKADLYGAGYVSFPIDLFFMDLDGTWYDTARTGDWAGKAQTEVFDGRSGNIDAEIWVSRIAASTMDGREEDIVKSYFERAHNRMIGNDTMPERAVGFYDRWAVSTGSVWQSDNLPYNPGLRDTFTSDYTFGNEELPPDTKENWIAALRKGYEYAMVIEHGSTNLNQFNGVNFTISDYNKMVTEPGGPSNVRFYNLVSCANGMFTGQNIATCYAVGHNGLLSICSTKPGGMLECYDLYTALSNGESFGSAFKSWYNNNINNKNRHPLSWMESWYYGMAIIGAGSLKLHVYTKGKTHQIIVSQNTGGTLNRSGRMMIAEGDSTTIGITPENRHQIECVLVDGDTVFRKQYPAFPYNTNTIDSASRTIPVATSYTFHNVHTNHTLDVVFSQRIEYWVTINALSGGFITTPPRGSPDTACHYWSGPFYEGDIIAIGAGTLFSPKLNNNVIFGAGRWVTDTISLAKAISMYSDMGRQNPAAKGRSSFIDTIQVFRDHYIAAAFESKKIYAVSVNEEGTTWDTAGDAGYSLVEQNGLYNVGTPKSGDCFAAGYDTSSTLYFIRDGEDMVFQTTVYKNVTLSEVLLDGTPMSSQSIISRTSYPGPGPIEICYVRFPAVTASHDIRFVFKQDSLP